MSARSTRLNALHFARSACYDAAASILRAILHAVADPVTSPSVTVFASVSQEVIAFVPVNLC